MHLSAECTPVARHGEPPAPAPTPTATPTSTPTPALTLRPTPTSTPTSIPDDRPGPAPRRHRLPGWRAWLVALPMALLAACGGGSTPAADTPTPQAGAVAGDRVSLGQMIFTDANLSEPRGTACAACHRADQGFAGNHGSTIGVPLGSTPGSFGLRNAMTNSYLGGIPIFHFETAGGVTEAFGGLFWDGRADTPAQQALGPLLNPLEMNNPDRKTVVDKVAASSYAALFRQEFGASIFNDTDAAFTAIGTAIAAFELAQLQPYSSKYDAMVRGQASLSPAETRGLALFMDPARANCAGCHLAQPGSGRPQDSPFSEFSYYATGVPRNTAIPANADPTFFDLGLCGPNRSLPVLPADAAPGTTAQDFCGKFRMPTLRNVAERPAFMHNGVFKDLREVVRFYATRNSDPQRWYGQATSNDLPPQYLRNIETAKAPFNRAAADGPALNPGEIDDIVAFLRTLSDGYRAP